MKSKKREYYDIYTLVGRSIVGYIVGVTVSTLILIATSKETRQRVSDIIKASFLKTASKIKGGNNK